MYDEDCLTRQCALFRHTVKTLYYYILHQQNIDARIILQGGTHTGGNKVRNKNKRQTKTANNAEQIHSTYSQYNPQLNLASPHQDKTERKQRQENGEGERVSRQSGEAFFELSRTE